MPEFIWPAKVGSSKEVEARLLEAKFGDGYAQRAADGLNHLVDTWQVIVSGEQAVVDAAEIFIIQQGGYLPFDWTPPLAAAALRVVCKKWRRADRNLNQCRLEMTFERDFQP